MRYAQASRNGAYMKRIHSKWLSVHLNNHPSSTSQLVASFGPFVAQLTPSLRAELVHQNLQKFPHRQDFFKKLETNGTLFLNVVANEHMGTRNVQIPNDLMVKFCELRKIGDSPESGALLLKHCIGAVSFFIGEKYAEEMIEKYVLSGRNGLCDIYLNALYYGTLKE